MQMKRRKQSSSFSIFEFTIPKAGTEYRKSRMFDSGWQKSETRKYCQHKPKKSQMLSNYQTNTEFHSPIKIQLLKEIPR